MTSESKKQLIYECAAEAVMQARVKIRRMHFVSDVQKNEIDDILSDAQMKAGRWAVDASEADTRTTKHHSTITGPNA